MQEHLSRLLPKATAAPALPAVGKAWEGDGGGAEMQVDHTPLSPAKVRIGH